MPPNEQNRRTLESRARNAWDRNAAVRAMEIASRDPAYLALQQIVRSHLHAAVDVDARILDAGCGVGAMAAALCALGYKVEGIDPSAVSIREAEATSPGGAFEICSIEEKSESAAGLYDAVVANMVLHTAFDLGSFLKAARQCLRPGGTFIATLPHPCFYLPSKEGFDGTSFDYTIESTHWLTFRIRRGQPHPSATPFIHRPISAYLDAMQSAGLTPERLEEPVQVGTGRSHDILVLRARR